MKINAENEADQIYRVVRKSDGQEVKYVTEANTDAGTYTHAGTGEDGSPTLSHRVAREVIDLEAGTTTHYDDDGNEVDEPEFVTEEVRESFYIVHKDTREVVAETNP